MLVAEQYILHGHLHCPQATWQQEGRASDNCVADLQYMMTMIYRPKRRAQLYTAIAAFCWSRGSNLTSGGHVVLNQLCIPVVLGCEFICCVNHQITLSANDGSVLTAEKDSLGLLHSRLQS